jgi:hypothetical protein
MRIARSTLAGPLLVGAILMALTRPGAIVFADNGRDAGADNGHHDAGAHGGGHDAGGSSSSGHDVSAGSGGGSSGGHHEVSSNGTDNNGDTKGDINSNMHTGAKGLGAGGDDKIRSHGAVTVAPAPAGAVTITPGGVGTVSTAIAPAPAATVFESNGGAVAGGAAAGVAGVEAAPAGVAETTGAGIVPGAEAIVQPSVPVLGAGQTAMGPAAPGQRFVLGTPRVRPRTLPFTGLSAAWAMLISNGRWAGILLGALGLMLLVRGLRRA